MLLISGPPSSKKQHVEHDEENEDMEKMEEGTDEGKDEHEWFSSDGCTICSVVAHHAGIRTRPKKLVLTHTLTGSICIKLLSTYSTLSHMCMYDCAFTCYTHVCVCVETSIINFCSNKRDYSIKICSVIIALYE